MQSFKINDCFGLIVKTVSKKNNIQTLIYFKYAFFAYNYTNFILWKLIMLTKVMLL